MKQYSVEIFNRSFNLVSHTNSEVEEYAEDYLSPVTNEVTVFNCNASKGDYIRIKDKYNEFFGIIVSIKSSSEKLMTISYASFLSIFDTDILFNTDLQGGDTSLEQTIANLITAQYINNTDSSMIISGLAVSTQGATNDWGFNLKSDTENMHHCIINFYDVIIARALEKYAVRIKVVPDIQNRSITLVIGKSTSGVVKIESDLQNVIEKNIIIKETSNDTNKLVVYNTENYTTTRVYYLHPNGSYDTSNTNRITPVIQEIKGTAPEREGSTITRTFIKMADSEAADVFGSINYNNLVELAVLNDDSLVRPYEMEIGQEADIYSKGKIYRSILTGKTVGQQTILTFGTIRLDLTKILKRRYS